MSPQHIVHVKSSYCKFNVYVIGDPSLWLPSLLPTYISVIKMLNPPILYVQRGHTLVHKPRKLGNEAKNVQLSLL